MLSTTSNVTKDLIIESNSRSVKVYKLHGKYRRDYMKEIYEDFTTTDYLITMADDSTAQLEITRGSPTRRSGDGKCRGSPSFKRLKPKKSDELTSEELELIKTKDPRQPFVPYRSPSARHLAQFPGSAGRVQSNSGKEFIRRYEFWRTRKLTYGNQGYKREDLYYSSRKASPSNTYSDYLASSGRNKISSRNINLEEEDNNEKEIIHKKIQFSGSDDENIQNANDENLPNFDENLPDVNDEDLQRLGENGPIIGANLSFDLDEEESIEDSDEDKQKENANADAKKIDNIAANQKDQNDQLNDEDKNNQPTEEEEKNLAAEEEINAANEEEENLAAEEEINAANEEEENVIIEEEEEQENSASNDKIAGEEEETELNAVERNIAIPEDQIIEEEEEQFEFDRDINDDLQYPPGFGPNTLGINAYALQKDALSDSSDDGDDRPSNCGCSQGGDGYAELVLQLSPEDFIPAMNSLLKGDFTLTTVPKVEYDTLRSKGFNWIYVEKINNQQYGLPQSAEEYFKLSRILHSSRLLFAADYINDELSAYLDGVFVSNESDLHHLKTLYPHKTYITTFQSEEATYFYDERPILSLRERNNMEIQSSIYNVNENLRCHFVHYLDSKDLQFNDRSVRTAAAMLLTLPGMRIINFRELGLVDLILIVLSKKALRRGVFSLVNATSNTNSLVAWKYTKGNQHILIAANFGTRQTTGHIICDDAPNAPSTQGEDANRIEVVDILTQTTYMREPEELRKAGLTVILYEYEIQIFEY